MLRRLPVRLRYGSVEDSDMSYEVIMLIGETAWEITRTEAPFFCINASLELGSAINKISEARKKKAICKVRIPNVLPFGDTDEEIEYVDAYGGTLLMYGLKDARLIVDDVAGSNASWEVAIGLLEIMDQSYQWFGKRGVVFYCK